ncbi:hypothetical protein MLD63_16375 [Paracoccus sp. TK19116]|uniref:Uncharacterized protein n=1 Tax=Paracoccus albicereus TaxID=2922394 RepID=A0ABT1MUJ4_9RHOB|nr:hypothetical protein [Paracoccus albicereus]MCQ0972000.1 hypothetical protein [Paracoccus albicereus]
MIDLYASDSSFPKLSDLQKRLSSSPGKITLALTDDIDIDQVEAFLIAVFETTESPYSLREQDALILSVLEDANGAETVTRNGCGVKVVLTADSCAIVHDGASVMAKTIAVAMLQALEELDDPAGMVLAGMAGVWESPSFEMTRSLSSEPRMS